jgi:hypothetical protein
MNKERKRRVDAYIREKGILKRFPFLETKNGKIKDSYYVLEDLLYEFSTREVDLIKKEEIIKLQKEVNKKK